MLNIIELQFMDVKLQVDNENWTHLEHPNRYVQGSVWWWVNTEIIRHGVQAKERPVLVISNDIFNNFSPVVNCVTITTTLTESPVHVPLFCLKKSHIQCEQVHTIPKNELVKCKGNVSKTTLLNVLEKLKFQFNMEGQSANQGLSVSSNSEPKLVANKIAIIMRNGNSVYISAIGVGSVVKAVESIAIARTVVDTDGIDLVCLPAFGKSKIQGKTSICFLVEKR